MRYPTRIIVVLLVILVGPNLIWLGTSTVRIHNAADARVDSVAFAACEKTHAVGTLEAGQSAFRFLEACGDDTLEILVGETAFCQIYVEGELYHVDATVRSADMVDCDYDDPVSSLFVAKVVW